VLVEFLQVLAGEGDTALGVLGFGLGAIATPVQGPADKINELLVFELLGLIEKPVVELLKGVQAHGLEPLDNVDLGRVDSLPVEVQEIGEGWVAAKDRNSAGRIAGHGRGFDLAKAFGQGPGQLMMGVPDTLDALRLGPKGRTLKHDHVAGV
jgi:hypothetical protein